MNTLDIDPLIQWRADIDTSLRREYGWLALSGLFWLEEGKNATGSAEGNPIRLPDRFPEAAGLFSLTNGVVSFQPKQGVDWRLNSELLEETSEPLKADASGDPDFLFLDDLRLGVIERADQLAIRIWDPQYHVRQTFTGRQWFEPNKAFRIPAKIIPYDPPKAVMVDDFVGIQREGHMDARLEFAIKNDTFKLDAERLEDDSFYVIFRDATAGISSYPAARYLVTDIAEGNTVVIDFNKAYNPPCAFTEYATCPLPQSGNILPVRIEAGERYNQAD